MLPSRGSRLLEDEYVPSPSLFHPSLGDTILVHLGKKEGTPDYLYLPTVLHTLLLQYTNVNNNEVTGLIYFILAIWNYLLYNSILFLPKYRSV